MHTVAVLALPDVIAFDLATPVELFGRARRPDGRPAYRVVVCGAEPMVDAGPVRLAVGAGLDELHRADTIVVPGRNHPEEPTPAPVLDALRAAAKEGTRIASICVGAFTLAETGLLDGLRATTHWLAADALAGRHPAVRVDANALYIDNGAVATSAGAAAGLDLCLHLVHRDHGVAVAADAARIAVAPLHRTGGQAQFIVRNPPRYATATLENVLAWIEENAHLDLTLADLATAAHTSVRTLNRRFHTETGQSPMEWVTGVRVRHAQELLETTDHGVERIARHVGFPSASNFRAHFRRLAGVTPHEYRSTFTGTAAAQQQTGRRNAGA
ncbi:Transcriptional regulator GlxA family, contains an amidase domain and an AraC-type DNA-binding HTH domain [Parafrankia irregularis]|uniref:Transcriptional regulator GlxA family, contains an amidase domain and an AraC-type DNA-binding HTH domain n=1 Tax=Parafrankia irregularis TaxID=795642 RepID=A0A0S4QYA1_9ACTN|nr:MULTISPECIES: helix-turn-helix domain-containing protein [Parafrankia]MBE3202303.1 helix-turn-helix domain-containing protein [Parafrankia sp. CH37]CUU59736.1 Transcriptional regulator GlxA family, contains an amidase domain and an AraC-type DNA-binding HTH domain [Parafrankia irregularis]